MAARSPSLPKQLADPNAHREAGEALQGLAGRVTLTPGEKRGEMRATLHGDLATIVEWTEHGGRKNKTDSSCLWRPISRCSITARNEGSTI
jgi:hypothetical protein